MRRYRFWRRSTYYFGWDRDKWEKFISLVREDNIPISMETFLSHCGVRWDVLKDMRENPHVYLFYYNPTLDVYSYEYTYGAGIFFFR